MEYLDYYDEDDNLLGYESREVVHEKGLWHRTVHCWLYDEEGRVFFQIRKDSNNTFYTTASGHVLHNENINEAFRREIKEEIGLDLKITEATKVNVVTWQAEKIKNGKPWIDHAKAYVYVDLFTGSYDEFKFDNEEVAGVALVDAREALKLFQGEKEKIKATLILDKGIIKEEEVNRDNFLKMEHETLIDKYGEVLRKIIELKKK